MYEKLHNDDILFDRLVDGELSAPERRQLLESLDARPQGWRRCALAFLEAQTWRSELRQVTHSTTAPATAAISRASDPLPPRTTMRAAAQWLAVAACLLVAFQLGSWRRDRGASIATNGIVANGSIAAVPPAIAPTPKDGNPGDALNLWVRNDAGQMQRVRVPLVDARALDQQLGTHFQTGVPADVRDELHDHGYTVQSKRQYAPMWLDNGRPMIVPVEDTKIVPVSSKAF